MMRHSQRRLPLIPWESGATKSIELPRDRILKRIDLQFEGIVVLADPGAGAAGTVKADSTIRLISKIEVIANGSKTIFRMDGVALYEKNKVENGTAAILSVPASGAAGNHTVSTNLQINFANNVGMNPSDTYLPASMFQTLDLIITWGSINDMFTGNTMTQSMASTYGIRPYVHETTAPMATLARIQDYMEKTVTATTTEFDIDLVKGDRTYQSFLFKTTDAGVRESDIINSFSLLSDEKTNHLANIAFIALQNLNKCDAELEAISAGIAYQYLLEDGSLKSGFNTFDVNTAKIRCDVTVGAGTTVIRVYFDYILPLTSILA